MDSGAGKPLGVELQGRDDAESGVRALLPRVASLGASGINHDASFDRDHAPFLVAGVPAFTLWVAEGDYDVRHHTVQDTFEHVDKQNLARDTAIMAILARALADAPSPVARRLSPSEASDLMRKIGVEGTRKMVYVED